MIFIFGWLWMIGMTYVSLMYLGWTNMIYVAWIYSYLIRCLYHRQSSLGHFLIWFCMHLLVYVLMYVLIDIFFFLSCSTLLDINVKGMYYRNAAFCYLTHNYNNRISKDLLVYWFKGICSNFER